MVFALTVAVVTVKWPGWWVHKYISYAGLTGHWQLWQWQWLIAVKPMIRFYDGSNDWPGGYTSIRYAGFCLDSDSSDSDSINSDSDIDSDIVCLCVHLQFCFMISQNYHAGEYINIRYALFPWAVTVVTVKVTMTVTVIKPESTTITVIVGVIVTVTCVTVWVKTSIS